MKVYHGSYTDITEISLSKTKKGKDFGKGFYVTKIFEDAEAMAKRQERWKSRAGVVSAFEFNYDRAFLSGDYKTKKFDGYTREWLDFVIENRKNFSESNIHDYDIVEGPIADDVVAERIARLPDNPSEDEKKGLLEDLKYRYTHQICFCNEVALDTIKRINLKPYFNVVDIGKSIITHLVRNDGIPKNIAQDLYFESKIYEKLSDEETGLYKKPWEEILNMFKKEIKTRKML